MLNQSLEYLKDEPFNENQNLVQLKTLWDLERKMNKQEKILPHDGNNFLALVEGKHMPYYSLSKKQISQERYRLNEMSKYQNK